MLITLSRAAFIAAASVVQAKQDIRYYLNGILIEKAPKSEGKDNGLLIVATDGHRLVAAHDESAEFTKDFADLPNGLIIEFSPDTLRAAKLVKNLDQHVSIESIEVEHVPDYCRLNVKIGGTSTDDSKKIGGQFPDWQRVTKDSRKRAIGWYSSEYLADFAKVAKFLNYQSSHDRAITLRADDKNSAATVHFGGIDYAFGMLMPMREDVDIPSLPAWAVGPFKKAA